MTNNIWHTRETTHRLFQEMLETLQQQNTVVLAKYAAAPTKAVDDWALESRLGDIRCTCQDLIRLMDLGWADLKGPEATWPL